MKILFVSQVAALFILAPSLSVQVAASTPHSARPDFSEARQLIRDWMAKDSLTGLAIAVARGDSILWEEGFGWANRALWGVANGTTVELVPTGKDAFFGIGGGPVQFERGADGKVGTLVLGGARLARAN